MGERITFSTNDAGISRYLHGKTFTLTSHCIPKINLKWIIKQSVRDETIEFLELQHIRQKSLRPWVRQTFLRQNSKNHKAVKEKNW